MSELHLYLNALIEATFKACQSWLISDDDGGLRLVDPVDQKTVIAHYGDSHLAAALIILGKSRGDEAIVEQGLQLVRTVLRDWNVAEGLADFHHDFNNFALCLVVEQLGSEVSDIVPEIKRVVLRTSDSKHDTVNWLPMRAYVNFCRHEWTGDRQFAVAGRRALEKVRRATNADGGIEDRLPRGLSYNLQYNVASLAALVALSRRWPGWEPVQDNSLDFLLSKVLPDGDINYMGRGANQLFAWGPWLYILASSRQLDAAKVAVQFLSSRYIRSIEKRNLMLNEFNGQDKSFWWDYHYCSVYHAHFLLWSVLAAQCSEEHLFADSTVKDMPASLGKSSQTATGLEIVGDEAGGAALFAGRTAYLAEAGPSICALWLPVDRVLFKGGLGPWKGDFGNKYSFADTVFQNHFGLLSQSTNATRANLRIIGKIFPNRVIGRNAVIKPVFSQVRIERGANSIQIVFETDGHTGFFNAPLFEDEANNIIIEFFVDGNPLRAQNTGRSRNQYGWISVWRSQLANGKRWEARIKTQTELTE
ncbi:hypothetical protein [Erythrobacter sp.]|uniref:hypothetical protein n=1 Tax=Erythrobacter sp. TaxID=1042 RepID=UPI001B2B3951|nr:hypothetical protein [Erythrobacter sp.]MBO6526352.1 hypothetical protein [Erythrobacter sp.]MBO6530605.1 hypothetical protein [Erythrobacter sp.]